MLHRLLTIVFVISSDVI